MHEADDHVMVDTQKSLQSQSVPLVIDYDPIIAYSGFISEGMSKILYDFEWEIYFAHFKLFCGDY